MASKNSDIDPGLLARLAANRTSRRRFLGGGAAAAAALALGPSFLAACGSRTAAVGGTQRHAPADDGSPAAAHCASRTGRCTWPTASSPRSRPPSASRWTTRKTSTTTRNGSPRTRNRCRASRTSAPTWWCPPSSWRLRLKELGWLNEISDARRAQQEEPAPRPARTPAVRPGPQVHRAVHVRHGRPGLQQGRHRPRRSPRSTTCGIRRSRARSACCPTRRTGSA